MFTDFWIRHLVEKVGIPQEMCAVLALWLVMTWVFKKEKEFNQVITNMQETSATHSIKGILGPYMQDIFPVPDSIIDTINKSRREHLTFLFSHLEAQIAILQSSYHNDIVCTNKQLYCDATILGTLMQTALESKLWPIPMSPYDGLSVNKLSSALRQLRVASYCDY
ncbi:hypothetical protein BJ875DRAFT_465606 [Amylocarpus encephaloides]|uniref:Uncharacterized protein n=1 Tax=Amylocarpus encephaloides TaxID=45428 RepID=A0A9P7YG41_9HELO|nr:hypothetical protein BJ875DRAFT_465606 [Amylocarpus encephaloides]